MEKTHIEISDAYRASRRNVSVFSGIALAWAAAQFDITKATLPLAGDVAVSQYSIPILLAVAIAYLMVRCTIEFMMQPVAVRRWALAQYDYRLTLVLAAISIPLLAASGISRSITTVSLVVVIGILLAVAYAVTTFLLTMIIMPIYLSIRSKRVKHPSIAGAAIVSTNYALALAGLFLMATIFFAGFPVLSWGYRFVGLSQPPATLTVMVFLLSCALFTIGCFLAHEFLKKVFAFQPPYTTKLDKRADGTIGVSLIPNPEADQHIQTISDKPSHQPGA